MSFPAFQLLSLSLHHSAFPLPNSRISALTLHLPQLKSASNFFYFQLPGLPSQLPSFHLFTFPLSFASNLQQPKAHPPTAEGPIFPSSHLLNFFPYSLQPPTAEGPIFPPSQPLSFSVSHLPGFQASHLLSFSPSQLPCFPASMLPSFPIPNHHAALDSFTAHTLNSGMPEIGSSAALVSRLAAAAAK
jgi:hypothetical protein